MSVGYNTSIVTDGLQLSLDFINLKNFNPSANIVSTNKTELKGAGSFPVIWGVINPQYVNFDYANGAAIFTRDLSPSLNVAQKNVAGGCIKTGGNLYSRAANTIHYTNFYYNDHTLEVWFKINNPAPSNYDGTEATSALVGHRGYNNGLFYDAVDMDYVVWNGSVGGNVILTWGIGSSSDIKPNQWHQIVATRRGNTWSSYIDGTYLSSATDNPAVNPLNNFQGELCLGATWRPSVNFQAYGVNTIANVKMYNKALSNTEIKKNFDAFKGRFDI